MRNEYEKTVLRLLAGRDFIATEEVAGLIGASPATARRLINRLAENRLLRRVHGVHPRRLDDGLSRQRHRERQRDHKLPPPRGTAAGAFSGR